MPVLPQEETQFPPDLIEHPPSGPDQPPRAWWVLHTKPRQEKSLARDLAARRVPFYLPLQVQRWRQGTRRMTSYLPLFTGYVFLFGTEPERIAALTTNRVVRTLAVADQEGLVHDLRQVEQLIRSGLPLRAEEQLDPGTPVSITEGPLAGLRGRILRRGTACRFVVEVNFLQRGASVEIDAASLQPLEP